MQCLSNIGNYFMFERHPFVQVELNWFSWVKEARKRLYNYDECRIPSNCVASGIAVSHSCVNFYRSSIAEFFQAESICSTFLCTHP